MSRDTILFDINETVLDLSSLKPLFVRELRKYSSHSHLVFNATSQLERLCPD